MKIDIISGFLGAGKTTLIKKILKEELYKEKIAIIENEYGEISIDGNLLRNEKIEVKEISSGCICCNIKGDFEESIKEIVNEYSPDRIIVEPSGVAKLSEIISSIKKVNIEGTKINMIITVLDVNNFDDYLINFGEFYRNQILNAKLIVLSRVEDIGNNRLNSILESIRKINKTASVITTKLDKLKASRIIEVGESTREKLDIEFKGLKPRARLRRGILSTEMFDNWGVETSIVFDEKRLNMILNKLSNKKEYGEVLRAKGIIPVKNGKWVQFDYVPNEININDYSSDYIGRICVIGKGIKKERLENLFLNK